MRDCLEIKYTSDMDGDSPNETIIRRTGSPVLQGDFWEICQQAFAALYEDKTSDNCNK